MSNDRYWTGVVMLLGPLTGLVFAGYARLLVPVASVEGTIRYRGRPVKGVAVCLWSIDRERCSDMVAVTDESGQFICRPYYWNPGPSRPRYTILVFPDPRRQQPERPTNPSRGATLADGIVGPPSGEVPRRTGRVLLASTGAAGSHAAPSTAPSGSCESALAPGERPLEVSLESARVYLRIDLKD